MSAEEEVAKRWDLLKSADREPEFLKLVAEAFERPELRQLFPFFSHDQLCFSRVAKHPLTLDCPFVRHVGEGTFEAFARENVLILRGDITMVLDAIVSNLPASCGPARSGSVRDAG
ncbi:MAG: DUF6193 family natural product biosynthesis protein [Minicystis sp.]